jgi:hypothetical protein
MNARGIAALADNPGCRRRAVLDASGVDAVRLADAADAPASYGQSAFAMVRGRGFEHTVLRNDAKALSTLLAKHYGVAGQAYRVLDLGVPDEHGAGRLAARVADTRTAIVAMLDGSMSSMLVVHPVIAMQIPWAATPVYLEPDALVLAGTGDGRIVCVEIKSRPVIDGVVDPAIASSAARQVAVYVHALRALLTELGQDPTLMSADALLVMPWNASNRPVGHPLDVRHTIQSLRRQLARMAQADVVLNGLPDGFTLDADAIVARLGGNAPDAVRAAAVAREVRRLPANYLPSCRSSCQMAEFCHRDAMLAGDPALLGVDVRDHLGEITDLYEAVRIARTDETRTTGGSDERALRRAAIIDAAARAEAAGAA